MATQTLASPTSVVLGDASDLSGISHESIAPYEGASSKPDEEKEAAKIQHEKAEFMIQLEECQIRYEILNLKKKWREILKKESELKSGHSTVRTPGVTNELLKPIASSYTPPDPTEPSSFKDHLLSAIGCPQDLSLLLIFNTFPDTSIFIARYGPTKFSLRPCRRVFAFSDQGPGGPDDLTEDTDDIMDIRDNSDVYFHLQQDAHRYWVASQEPHWVPDITKSDRFIAIGWLVESNESEFHRTTNYVCCLNLSTEPISVWLIYDYYQRDSDPSRLGYLRTIKVPDSQSSYNSILWDHEESHTSCPYQGKATKKCSQKTSRLDPRKPGYMEQDAPWDIALLYDDIADWPTHEKFAMGNSSLTTFGPAIPTLRVRHEELNGLKCFEGLP